MNLAFKALLPLFFLAAASVPSFAQTGETLEWARAARTNTCEGYDAFLHDYPAGEFTARAKTHKSALNCPDPERDAAEAKRRADDTAAENAALRDKLRAAEQRAQAAQADAAAKDKALADARAAASRPAPVTPVAATTITINDFLGTWTAASGGCLQQKFQMSGTNVDWDVIPSGGSFTHKEYFAPVLDSPGRKLSGGTGVFYLSGSNMTYGGCTFTRTIVGTPAPAAAPVITINDFLGTWTAISGGCQQQRFQMSGTNVDWDVIPNGGAFTHKEYFAAVVDSPGRKLSGGSGVFYLSGSNMTYGGCTFSRTVVGAPAPAAPAAAVPITINDFLGTWTAISGGCTQQKFQMSGANVDWDVIAGGALTHKEYFAPVVDSPSRKLSGGSGVFYLSGSTMTYGGCTFTRAIVGAPAPAAAPITINDFLGTWTAISGGCAQQKFQMSGANVDWDVITGGALTHKEYFPPVVDSPGRKLSGGSGVFYLSGSNMTYGGCTFRR